MQVRIDPDQGAGVLRPFFSHIHFHPTDAIEDDWGREILDRIARDGAARTVRMYAMLEDIVTVGEDGRFRYDFTDNDRRLDYLVSHGFDILLSYNFIPPCISSDPEEVGTVCKNPTRYKGKFIATAPPRDYGEWEEICRVYTEHIVSRYGMETVGAWMLQCYNEPDEDQFFMKRAGSERERAEAYCRLYRHFVRGVHSVAPTLRVGGPALGSHLDFLAVFLDFVREEALPLDFIYFHTYGVHPNDLAEGGLSVLDLEKKAWRVIDLCRARGFGDRVFINDEWGAATCGYFNSEENPLLLFRETEVFSAYYAKLIAHYDRIGMPIERMMLCLSGQHEMRSDFSGFRGFFTLHGYPKPIYNAYVLASRLGRAKLAVSEIPDPRISLLATRREDGTAAVLISYADECFSGSSEPISLTLRFPRQMQGLRLWRIDSTHASAMHAHRLHGSPDEPDEATRRAIADAASVKPESLSPSDTVTLELTANAVVLLEAQALPS